MKTGAKRARLDSPVSAAAVLDRRVVIVKSDQARSRIADLSSFIQGIEEERDAALAKVCDLETTVSELEADNERIPQLENDVSYWRTDREEQKTAKDNFEMELRRAKEDLQRLNAVIASNTRDIEANKKVHKNKDQQIEKLNTDNMRLRSEMAASLSEHKDTLADLNFRLQEKNVNCQQMTEALNAAIQETKKAQSQLAETDRIKAENERIEEENENLKLDLSDRDQANERLERELHEKNTIFGAEKLDNIRLTENMRRLEVLFMDAYKLSAEGTGYLLGSGRMLSLHSIARAWARDAGFNGDPTYLIKCIETNTFTTVVRSPAVSRFTRDIADIINLDTVPDFHFKFSDHPVGAQPVRWTVYNPYDQLTLIAKLIYIAKSNTESASMQAMVMDGHVVTATCTKNMQTCDANIVLTLNITTRQGVSQPHHIEFVRPDDGDEVFFPRDFDFTVGAAATAP